MVTTWLPAILHQKPGAVYLVADEKIELGILSPEFMQIAELFVYLRVAFASFNLYRFVWPFPMAIVPPPQSAG